MLGPVFSLPRDVTFGHSRQWRTMKGPTMSWADMEGYAGRTWKGMLGMAERIAIKLSLPSSPNTRTFPVNHRCDGCTTVSCVSNDDSGVRRCVELEG